MSRKLKAKEPRAFVVLGPKDEELVYFGDGGSVFSFVQYPYRKSPDLYLAIRESGEVFCCQCGDDDETPRADGRPVGDGHIRMPKRGPSEASSRRLVRHLLSHHRRHRTLLPWWDSDPKLVDTNVKRLALPTDEYKQARGAVPVPEGGLSAEEAIRRGRGG